MPPTISITNNTDTYVFTAREMPLISRRVNDNRRVENGPNRRTVSVRLSGFFTGAMHSDVVTKYQNLLKVLKSNEVYLTYTDGVTTIYDDKRCFPSGYTEPQDWKQYSGDYNFNLLLYEQGNNDTTISASYVSTGGTYTFDPIPIWSSSYSPNRNSPYSNRYTPNQALIAREATIELTGFVTVEGPDHVAIAADMQLLRDALKHDGTLNYGSWSDEVRVVNANIPPVFPTDYYEYSITFAYQLESEIYKFESKRTYPRIHKHPLIKNHPYCFRRTVKEFNTSGQLVQYVLSVWSKDITTCRAKLSSEAANLISPGGIEMPGGSEQWDDQNNSVILTIPKYYDQPVLANLSGTFENDGDYQIPPP